MNLLAIAFPEISEADYGFIEKHRKAQDPLHEIVKPHFTLVFPLNVAFNSFSFEIKNQLANTNSFSFSITHATVNKDDFSNNYFTFLIPGVGNSEFMKLHVKLYSGKLAIYHRKDIDYIPHITICKSKERNLCQMLADELNNLNLEIKGMITSIDIINYENNSVTPLEKIKLK